VVGKTSPEHLKKVGARVFEKLRRGRFPLGSYETRSRTASTTTSIAVVTLLTAPE
jgi:hypothetical protein